VAILSLLWGSGYLGWRLAWSWRGANPVAFAALTAVEVYNLTSLALLAFLGWSWAPAERPAASPYRSVDVFVCTYNEPADVVEATLAGCAGLTYPHETWLLDDGRRQEMAALARRWGAHWLTRPDNSHAKAGNINHALEMTAAELIFVLDADHVPLPDALSAVVGYFDDPEVALVQSPHDFYNQDSVQHYEPGRHEQSLFFEVVCPGKDRYNAAFWCGSATMVRRVALRGVGGVGVETIAEDFHTTIKMHRQGWRTRYHNEVLVQGLAPVDLDGYLLQRDRWARGNLAVFRLPESPIGRRCGLDARQRVSYFSSLYAYGAGATRLLVMALLIASLGFGILPAKVAPFALWSLWLPATVLALTATTALCRGHMRLGESSHYTLITAEVFTRALRCAVVPSRTKFKVTPKEGTDTGGWPAVRRLRVVLVLGVALVATLCWRALALVGVVHARPLPGIALPLAVSLGIWETVRIVRSIRRVARRRQRRVQYRFACDLPAVLAGPGHEAGIPVRLVDAAVAGLGFLAARSVPVGSVLSTRFDADGVGGAKLPVGATVEVKVCRPEPGGLWRIGTSAVVDDEVSRANLLTFCFVVCPAARLRPALLEPASRGWSARPDVRATPVAA